MSDRCTGVIGAGIIGLAVARRLQTVAPGMSVVVLDKESQVATHQTGHNSGVVHAGLYYPPGSLKAALCRTGRTLLQDYCVERRLTYIEAGKLVIARNDEEAGRLRVIEQRARANQVPDLAWFDSRRLVEIEPHAVGVGALYSPHTAIVDFAEVARSFAADVIAGGGTVKLGCPVSRISQRGDRVAVLAGDEELVFDRLVVCAGLQSDRVARLAGDSVDPMIVPFRGEYFRLVAARTNLVRGLIYPVPDPAYPFLGVHFTRRVDGGVDIGPNAVLALAREGYLRRAARAGDVWELMRYPGFRRLAARHWRMGARELLGSVSKRMFLAAARSFVPELGLADVERAPAGVRAQALRSDGSLLDDFLIDEVGPVVAVRNAPSPAATSSMAIAEHIVGNYLSPDAPTARSRPL
jgi:L-2-hydroxyglutarate oxidase LhgO